jgi:peroxiredoxin
MRNRRSPSPTGSPGRTTRLAPLAAAWLGLVAASAAASAAESAAGAPPSGAGLVLHLTSGGTVPGTLADSDRPGVLRWQGVPFASPFDFAIEAVAAVHCTAPTAPPKPVADYCVELAADDVLFGALVDLNDTAVVLDVPRLGRLNVRRDHVRRITRVRDGGELVYLGPNGLSGWRSVSPEGDAAWREDGGALVTDKPGAALFADVGLPERAAVELELSWAVKDKPDFAVALGADDDERSARGAFRLEVWEGDLVALRETDREADVAPVARGVGEAGAARLRLYLDQERQRLLVDSLDGKPLADLQVSGPGPRARPGVRLENKAGNVRLEGLRVSRWDGKAPHEAPAASSSLRRADGSAVPGAVVRYDASSKAFVVRRNAPDGQEADETRVPEDDVSSITLRAAGAAGPRSVRAVFRDGTRLSGEWLKVEKGEVWLSVPGVTEPAHLPADDLRSLVVLRHERGRSSPTASTPRLETEGVRLPGRLVDGRERPGASCLVWQPEGSATASPLRPGVSGRIVYKEPPPPPPAQPAGPAGRVVANGVVRQVQPGGVVVLQRVQPAGGLQGFVRGFASGPSQPTPADHRRSIYLRTGDVIPSEVTKIDETGVTFRSPVSEKAFVPHDKIKAVELADSLVPTVRLTRSKRDRLLMVPRMHKGSPPTQLIRSKNGDYLRGRIVAMDDKTLQVETRLETRTIPRDRIARIIWLHADEITSPDGPAPSPAPPAAATARPPAGDATRVQAVRKDGIRVTFAADRVEDATLSGKSDVLGACRVRTGEVDQILFGAAIEQEAAKLAYQQWKLQYAPEPKVAQNDGGASSGTESAMVGKPAPDFQLELLDGKSFRLSEGKGHVVVLDFWATWCGPCLQAMPQVDKVTKEFKDKGVQLVAVNLQESPREIKAMLERHKLDMTVALDRDGAVAEKYGANAIPQTVVIDRDGKVSRLYVGGGPHLGEQLSDALQKLLDGETPKDQKP